MKRFFYSLFLLIVVLPLAAQMPPDWYNAASRRLHYPNDSYYTGYVEGDKQPGEALENAMSRLKDAARVELVATIRTSVEQTMHNRTTSDLRQSSNYFEEDIQELHTTETRISSCIRDIPGLKVDAYQDPKTGVIFAFAYVKRSTLIAQLTRRISVNLGKAEASFSQAEQMVADGQKKQARSIIEQGLQHINQVEETQGLLMIVDEEGDEESFQLAETQELKRKMTDTAAQLRNAIAVCLICKAKLFNADYSALDGMLRGELSNFGVTFVDDPTQAEWTIIVSAVAQRMAKTDFGQYTNYAACAEADIYMDKSKSRQRIYSNHIKSKTCNHTRGYNEAAREAYHELSSKLSAIIKTQIL